MHGSVVNAGSVILLSRGNPWDLIARKVSLLLSANSEALLAIVDVDSREHTNICVCTKNNEDECLHFIEIIKGYDR